MPEGILGPLAIAPPQGRTLTPCGGGVGHETDAVQTGLMGLTHQFDNATIRYRSVGPQPHFGIRIAFAGVAQRGGHCMGIQGLVVYKDLSGLVHRQRNELGRLQRGGSGRLGQVHLDFRSGRGGRTTQLCRML